MAQARSARSASLRAMARIRGGKSALIEVKAVDGAYPLYGEVVVTEPNDAGPDLALTGVMRGRALAARAPRRRDRQHRSPSAMPP